MTPVREAVSAASLDQPDFTLIEADVLDGLRTLNDASAHCLVTSPPYFGHRSYEGVEPKEWPDGWHGLLGLEPTPEMYVGHLVMIFGEVKRVLRKDGSVWLNIGDTYASDLRAAGLKRKDLMLIPGSCGTRATG